MRALPASVSPDVVEVATAPRGATLTLGIPQELSCFRGHFDQCAILPGVVQIAWALQFARQYLGAQCSIDTSACVGMKSIKFTRVITPLTSVQLRLDVAADGKSLSFSYSSANAHYSSGTLLLQ